MKNLKKILFCAALFLNIGLIFVSCDALKNDDDGCPSAEDAGYPYRYHLYYTTSSDGVSHEYSSDSVCKARADSEAFPEYCYSDDGVCYGYSFLSNR